MKTTEEVAGQYYALMQQGKRDEVWETLYSNDIVCIEPEHAAAAGVPTVTKGIDNIRAKSDARAEMIEQIHGGYCSQPVVGGNYFSVAMGRDVTFKGKPRVQLNEIGVFHVTDGKIVLEQFFY